MLMRLAIIVGAVAAGAAAGAVVFKIVGEQRIGSQVRVLSTRFGFRGTGDSGALDLIEGVAPGTKAGFESAVIGTVVASVLVTAAVTVAIAEVTQ